MRSYLALNSMLVLLVATSACGDGNGRPAVDDGTFLDEHNAALGELNSGNLGALEPGASTDAAAGAAAAENAESRAAYYGNWQVKTRYCWDHEAQGVAEPNEKSFDSKTVRQLVKSYEFNKQKKQSTITKEFIFIDGRECVVKSVFTLEEVSPTKFINTALVNNEKISCYDSKGRELVKSDDIKKQLAAGGIPLINYKDADKAAPRWGYLAQVTTMRDGTQTLQLSPADSPDGRGACKKGHYLIEEALPASN